MFIQYNSFNQCSYYNMGQNERGERGIEDWGPRKQSIINELIKAHLQHLAYIHTQRTPKILNLPWIQVGNLTDKLGKPKSSGCGSAA